MVRILGFAKGQTYAQTDTSLTYKIRDWTFNGTPGTTHWLDLNMKTKLLLLATWLASMAAVGNPPSEATP